MILLDLFLTFLTIGAVSFGGGYGMISLIRESVVHHGWLTEEAFMSFVAVSEATPGPLAVNMATFVGSSQAGIPGALAATIGEEAITIEDVYEPYLLQIGFLARTPRGRCATHLAYEHLGLQPQGQEDQQVNIFTNETK